MNGGQVKNPERISSEKSCICHFTVRLEERGFEQEM
jgi:hypothetical protein